MPDDTPTTTALAERPRVSMGLAPTTLEEGFRLAKALANSTLVPKDFVGKADNVLVAMQLGMELGLAPMQSLQSIAVINGKPSIYGDGFLALIMASPAYADHDEYYEVLTPRTVDDIGPDGPIQRTELFIERRETITIKDLAHDATTAVCTFYRRNKATPVSRAFSVGDAKRAGLWNKPNSPWGAYPARMLLMRARSWAGRDCFPDVLRGLRTSEEAMDEEPQRATLREMPRERQALSQEVRELVEETRRVVDAAYAPEPPPQAAAPAPGPVDITEGLPVVDDTPHVTVTNVHEKTKNDKTWWVITFSDGTSASTWSKTIATNAQAAEKLQVRVHPQVVEQDGRRKLVALGGI